jgi:hypothetical protein
VVTLSSGDAPVAGFRGLFHSTISCNCDLIALD